jgi:hypothetical protein
MSNLEHLHLITIGFGLRHHSLFNTMHRLIYLLSLSVVIYSTANSSENYSSSTFLTRLEVRESVFPPGTISTDGPTKIIELILETVGLQASFEVKKADVPNAAAICLSG